MERLLIDRVVTCWLQLAYFDALIAQTGNTSQQHFQALERRQDNAQRRYLAAVRGLTLLRKNLPSVKPKKLSIFPIPHVADELGEKAAQAAV